MSSLRSRFKGLLRRSKPSQTTEEVTAIADSDHSSTPSTSKVKPKRDELGFLELAPGIDPIVDIVAIHGLDGHRENTWTAENGILWLRDLLPSDLPNARVLSYGYDADTRSGECVSTQTIRRHADGFAKALSRRRKDAPRRPIIFVAHGLGGIILKWALVICHNQSLESKGDLRDVLVSAHAVLFFGTPHIGLEGTTLVTAINRLASVYMKTTDVILKDLRAHSSELENIQSLYVAASEKISTIFFCEEYATSGVGTQGLRVPHHSAVIAGDRNATTIVLHANHRDLVRFSVKDDDDYKTTFHYLNDYVDTAVTAVGKKWAKEDTHRNVERGEPAELEVARPKPRPLVSRNYIERREIQSLITQKLLLDSRVKRQPRCVLHGLGGSGKTQLATNWIEENESSFTRVIVVDASSQAQLEADLELSIRSIGPEYSKMTWKDAVAYLDGKERGWLLFVDNADALDLDLRPYLPRSTGGAILITTRNRECVDYAPDGAIPVGGLEESEAVNLLHTVADITPTSNAKSLEIVRELWKHALAITHAGAYIRKTRRLDAYLDTFRKHRDQLLRKQPDRSTGYTSSTYTAFDLSYRQLPAQTQGLMKLFAYLHHSVIPVAVFEKSAESGFAAYTFRSSCPPPEGDKIVIANLVETFGEKWNQVAFQEIIDSASRASLINVSTNGLYYSVHPLVQTYIKDNLGEEETQRCMRTTAQLLLGAIRPSKEGNSWYWELLPHVNSIPRSLQSENVAHALAFHELYESLGDWKPCRELLEPALSHLLDARGQRHEESIWLMGNLATALRRCGHLDDAEKMQREVLALQLEIFGGQHPDTIRAMNNLAVTLGRRGQLDEAEELKREVLALRLNVLGGRDLDTIQAMGNLAVTLSDRGQLDEAEKVQREVLALRLDILGIRHPDTIHAMGNLAATLNDRGQLEEAEKVQREVLALRLNILGGRHPDTILAMGNLASILHSRGQLDEAEKLKREVLALRLEDGTQTPSKQ